MAAIFPAQEDDMFSRNLQKRYNGLVMVRTRAIKGKGAWYWYHLEPILLQNQDTGMAKALKLRCGLCSALFSASNPSRTASEHLKRGTCPKFRIPEANSNGIMAKIRKHDQLAFPAPLPPLALIPSPCSTKQMAFNPSIRPQLPQNQIDTAFNLLTEWFYESCGYVSLSTLNHPKFKAFLHHVGLPPVNKNDILGRRLDAKYVEAKFEFEDKLHDAMFFQLSTNGWKNEGQISSADENALVNVSLNLPNGSSLFHRVLFLGTSRPNSDYIRDVLSSTIREVSDGNVLRCAGLVADISNINSEALRELELQHHWMVSLTCQTKALHELLRDFFKRLPLFASTASLCHKLVQIYKSHQHNDIIICLNHNQTLSLDQTSAAISSVENFARFACAMTQAARVFANKVISSEPLDQELSDAIQDPKFWRELDSVVSLAKLIKTLVHEMEEEKPCLGQCLPLWEEVKSRIKGWCNSFSIDEKPVMELVNRRFSKNYHQAWAASFILDPLYLVEDNCGRYLPPFKLLNPEQQKDVAKIITRLTKKEEAHIALMELMKWRTEGLDPVYAKAVQAKESDPVTGKMKVVNPRGGRLVWETYLTEFKVLRKVAARLIFLQATTGQLKWNEPFLSLFCNNSQSNSAVERAQKVLFVSAHGRLERKEFTDEQEKDPDNSCMRQNIYSPDC